MGHLMREGFLQKVGVSKATRQDRRRDHTGIRLFLSHVGTKLGADGLDRALRTFQTAWICSDSWDRTHRQLAAREWCTRTERKCTLLAGRRRSRKFQATSVPSSHGRKLSAGEETSSGKKKLMSARENACWQGEDFKKPSAQRKLSAREKAVRAGGNLVKKKISVRAGESLLGEYCLKYCRRKFHAGENLSEISVREKECRPYKNTAGDFFTSETPRQRISDAATTLIRLRDRAPQTRREGRKEKMRKRKVRRRCGR